MKSIAMAFGAAILFASCGQSKHYDSQLTSARNRLDKLVVVKSYAARAVSIINQPTDRAVEVEVTFESGSNACNEMEYIYSIRQSKGLNGRVDVVVVSARNPKSEGIFCTTEYVPVFKTLKTTIRSTRFAPAAIYVDNVGKLGNHVFVSK